MVQPPGRRNPPVPPSAVKPQICAAAAPASTDYDLDDGLSDLDNQAKLNALRRDANAVGDPTAANANAP